MKAVHIVVIIAMLALAAAATPAGAKEGLFVGAYVLPTVDISGVPVDDGGSGYGFRAGMGFGRYLSIDALYEKTDHDITGGGTAKMSGVAVDLRLNFPLTSLDAAKVMSLEPYILVGYGVQYEIKASGSSSSGGGLRYGFGIEQYLFRELSVNAGWTRTEVSFDSPLNKDGTIRAFDLGLTYHFL